MQITARMRGAYQLRGFAPRAVGATSWITTKM